jgi:hypothetical protein
MGRSARRTQFGGTRRSRSLRTRDNARKPQESGLDGSDSSEPPDPKLGRIVAPCAGRVVVLNEGDQRDGLRFIVCEPERRNECGPDVVADLGLRSELREPERLQVDLVALLEVPIGVEE